TLRDDRHADFVLFGRIEHERPCTEGWYGCADLRLLSVADSDHAEHNERDATRERAENHVSPVTEPRRREYKATNRHQARPFSCDSVIASAVVSLSGFVIEKSA